MTPLMETIATQQRTIARQQRMLSRVYMQAILDGRGED